jgi:hypothetical protein
MWHVGIHVWEVPWNELEPNYDDYYAVSHHTYISTSTPLTTLGQFVFQPPQPPNTTTRQSVYHPASVASRLRHRMAQARSLCHSSLHHRKRIDSVVSLHFRLSTTDR